MRLLLAILALALLPSAAFCQNKKKPKSMPVSRWREVKRISADSTIRPFSDTLFIAFRKNDSFSYHVKDGFIYNGKYTIDDDSLLDFGTARYKMVLRKPTSMVLTDAMGVYYFGVDSSDTAAVIVMGKDEKLVPVTNIDQMIGRWTVYKRTSDQPPTALDNENQVRSIFITGPSTDGKQGFVFSSKDPTNVPSWFIKALNVDQTLDVDGKSKRVFKVIKCQGGEMILEESGIKFYLKQFR